MKVPLVLTALLLAVSACSHPSPPPAPPATAAVVPSPTLNGDPGVVACQELGIVWEQDSNLNAYDHPPVDEMNRLSGLFASSKYPDLAQAGVDWTHAYLSGSEDVLLRRGDLLMLDMQCDEVGAKFLGWPF